MKILFALVLAFLVVPVLFTQLSSSESRDFESVSLGEISFQEIRFRNEEQDLSLAGMLLVPDGNGPFPAAVFIHGSGTSRRDNGWYLTVAKYLQDHGVVVLLPDKRGSVNSEGDWTTASIQDLATDTSAAIDYLQNHDGLEISALGLVGMSQGGKIAPVVAVQNDNVDFVVNVVGGAVPMHEGLVYEENHNLREVGLLPGFSDLLAYPAAWSLIYARQTDFWRAIGNFDPLPYWELVRADALVLYGADDTNVPSRRSARLLRSLGKRNIEVVIYEGSGHALESPPGQGNDIFRRGALETINTFIHTADVSN